MSETIIIESNRQIAYNLEKTALRSQTINYDLNKNFPNHEWQTNIPDGISIDVGDQIQVEAVMINSKGGGDDVIEFTGIVEGDRNSKDVGQDNHSYITANYYIIDKGQFNIKLPKREHIIHFKDILSKKYGSPDLTTYENFCRNYYQGSLEGVYWDTSQEAPLPNIWSPIAPQGSNHQPAMQKTAPLYNFITNERFYLMSETWNGLYTFGDENVDEYNHVTTYSKNIEFKSDIGFNQPGALGERMTSQFHARDGNSNDFQSTTLKGGIFFFDPDKNIVFEPTTTITDQSYLSVPTASGKLLFGRMNGKWSSKFKDEIGDEAEGTGYNESQAISVDNSFILTTKPYRLEAASILQSVKTRTSGADEYTESVFYSGALYTGLNEQSSDGKLVGKLGRQIVYFDICDFITSNQYYYKKVSDYQSFNAKSSLTQVNDMEIWDIPNGRLIPVNIPYTAANLETISLSLQKIEEPQVDFQNFEPTTDEFRDGLRCVLNLGEMDDMNSCGTQDDLFFLPSPAVVAEEFYGTTMKNSYPAQTKSKFGYTSTTWGGNHRLANLQDNFKGAYEVNVNSRFTQALDISKGPTYLSLGTNSMWEIDYGTGINYSQIVDVGIIPVKLKEPYRTQYKLIYPMCAFVSSGGNERIPAPMIGEFFGISRSLYDIPRSQISSTQKTSSTIHSKAPYYPADEKVRILDYAPFCYIGADNPTIIFDGDNSKFALKSLHTSSRSGNGVFPDWEVNINTQPNTSASDKILSINAKTSTFCYIASDGNIGPFSEIDPLNPFTNTNYCLAQSGIAIQKVGYYTIDGALIDNNPYQPEYFKGTLFSKIGFSIEQLMPFFGKVQAEFNRGNVNMFLGNSENPIKKLNNMVKPLTTNDYVSGSINVGVVVNQSDNPMENLGICIPGVVATTNSESDELIAQNLASKLDYPYLILYSNIVENNRYYGGPDGYSKLPAMAYIARNYTSGDFFYSFATSWSYTADKNYVITDIQTSIRTPDGLPAPLDEASSVIYRITKPKIMPTIAPLKK
mgnify:CR=1 FL=1